MLPRRYTGRLARCWARGGGGRGAGAGAGAALLALAALAALAALRVPLTHRSQQEVALPRAPPYKLAAHLADFNNLRKFYPHIESWRIDEQWSNYTSWRYSVVVWCGARCGGRGAVEAHDEYGAGAGAGAAPAHGHAAVAHEVRLHLAECRTLPLLPWPAFCDEVEVEWRVEGDGSGGARLREAAAARAALGAALLRALRGEGAGEGAGAGALRGEGAGEGAGAGALRGGRLDTLRDAFP